MITRQNLPEILQLISSKDIKRIKDSNKEYVVLYLHTFNVGSYVSIKLTDNLHRYQNVSNNGNCILSIWEIINSI